MFPLNSCWARNPQVLLLTKKTQMTRRAPVRRANANKSVRSGRVGKAKRTTLRRQVAALSRNPAVVRPNRSGMDSHLIPVDEIYSYQNRVPEIQHSFPGSEYVTRYQVTSAMPAGLVLVNKYLNPMLFPSTRLFNMARNFEEFRFIRARIIHIPVVGTAVDGGLIMSYFSNPDFDVGTDPTTTLFNSGGYKTAIRLRGQVTAKLDSVWRKCDPDSNEIMQTTQGKFVVAIDTPTTAAGTMTFNLIMEYVIEFRKPTTQTQTYSNVGTMAPASWVNSGGGTFTSSVALSITPAIGDNFLINPAIEIPGPLNSQTALYAQALNTGGTQFKLFESFDKVGISGGFILNGNNFNTSLLTMNQVVLN